VNDRRGLSALALLTSLACSSSPSQNPYLPPTGAGGTGPGTTTPSGTVAVAFLSPPTPSDGSTVASSSDLPIGVTVDIVGGTDFVAAGSVKATVTATGSTAAAATGQLVAASADIFNGTISLSSLKLGSYTLTVAATSSGGAVGQASIGIVIDDGPAVSVSSPIAGKSYNGTLTVEFTADFGAIGPSTSVSPNPSATVGGLAVQDLAADTSPNVPPNSYRGTVAFDVYSPPLTGVQLLDVKATNANGVLTEVRVLFSIDNTGPTITLTTPATGQVVGGVINISATINDDSGVFDSSVIAIIGDQNNPVFNLPLTPKGGGVYGVIFDTANLTRCVPPPATSLCLVYPTISFRASDTLGNQTVLGYDFSVDNVPPVADLDPPPIRDVRVGTNGYECSFAFDPLSVNRDIGDMPNDGCLVPQVFDLRARIEDDGNRASGLKVVPIAGIDPDNTSVYVLHDIGQPLVVDSDGDGNCDQINPLLVPTTDPPTAANQVLKIRLAGVPPAGLADFEPDKSLVGNTVCAQGSALTPPPLLCSFQQPTIAISYAGDQPAVWSVEPIDSFRCLGNQFDALANHIPEGWACLAIQTVDLAGNQGVSVPMRVYIQYGAAGGFCGSPPAGAGPPPTCTGTFTASADPTVSGVAAIGACGARKFTATEYCYLGDCPGPS
jgi:Bacterial Ig domain